MAWSNSLSTPFFATGKKDAVISGDGAASHEQKLVTAAGLKSMNIGVPVSKKSPSSIRHRTTAAVVTEPLVISCSAVDTDKEISTHVDKVSDNNSLIYNKEGLEAMILKKTWSSSPPSSSNVNNFHYHGHDTFEREITSGKFGKFGGKFVPETLITCLNMLEVEFNSVLTDPDFQKELGLALTDYVGRESPLYFAQRLTDHYKNDKGEGPEIYLKREDLVHGGSHKMNNAIAQAMMAKRMGRTKIIAATGAGQHGVATAASCAKLSLECTIFMGTQDIQRQPSNVLLIKHLGAHIKVVDGSFKDAMSEAIRNWVGNLENSYLLMGTAVGPHPCPTMVREFQSVIGKETRKQAMEKWGGKPDVLVACVGTGSNALGLFHEFIEDENVRLIGVEGAGCGFLDIKGSHSATLARGEVGVYHGSMTYLLQDEEGQIVGPRSIGVGLEYPGVSPELSFLKDTGRAEFDCVTDEEALNAYERMCRLEGIFPALEACHALAYLEKLCPKLENGTKVVVNCSGSGEKDFETVFNRSHLTKFN